MTKKSFKVLLLLTLQRLLKNYLYYLLVVGFARVRKECENIPQILPPTDLFKGSCDD